MNHFHVTFFEMLWMWMWSLIAYKSALCHILWLITTYHMYAAAAAVAYHYFWIEFTCLREVHFIISYFARKKAFLFVFFYCKITIWIGSSYHYYKFWLRPKISFRKDDFTQLSSFSCVFLEWNVVALKSKL